jgi:hypothetical protein
MHGSATFPAAQAVDELDHAIRDIRDVAFDLGPQAR